MKTKKESMILFEALTELVQNNKNFYFKDDETQDYIIRSFSYNTPSFLDFENNDYARDCRGTAFIYDKQTQEWDIFCRSPKKSHNLGEGVQNLEEFMKTHEIISTHEKLDGSLIHAGLDTKGQILMKSKTSIYSEQAKLAQKLLQENTELQRFIITGLLNHRTPVFELCGTKNRIVIDYNYDAELIFLGEIHHETGKVYRCTDNRCILELSEEYNIRSAKCFEKTWDELMHEKNTCTSDDIEGYIVCVQGTQGGTTDTTDIKVKTEHYRLKHRLKDKINSKKALIRCVLSSDCFRNILEMFETSEDAQKEIIRTKEVIDFALAKIQEELKQIILNKGDISRKEFAKKYRHSEYFSALMKLFGSLYNVQEITKEFVLKASNSETQAQEFLETFRGLLGTPPK